MQKLAWLAMAGALGTLARYGLSDLVNRINGASMPWGTMAVNVIGSFLAGMVWILLEHRWDVPQDVKLMIMVGFMGAFTTFSSLMMETGHILRTLDWTWAMANLTLQNVLGFAALFAGMTMARML